MKTLSGIMSNQSPQRERNSGKIRKKRGCKAIYREAEKSVIINIWKSSEQPCGILLKEAMPLWLDSYETKNDKLNPTSLSKILLCSAKLPNLIN